MSFPVGDLCDVLVMIQVTLLKDELSECGQANVADKISLAPEDDDI